MVFVIPFSMIVSLEGNIGAGKTSVLERLQARGYAVRPEPVDEWDDFLTKFYENPAEWALPFNLKVLHSFARIDFSVFDSHIVVERSPSACRHVFGQLAYNDNHLSPAAWDVFKEYHELLGWKPDAYIYIQTPVEVCYERMQRRSRECEQGVTMEYLSRIDFQYENMLRFSQVPVHRIDGTGTPDQIADHIVLLLAQTTGSPVLV